MKNSKKRKLCVYCGIREATESEHVIPKALFPKPLPQIMVTVPPCGQCNDEKKDDDEYLRDMMIVDIENAGHPAIEGHLKGKLLRAASRGQSRLAGDVIRLAHLSPVHTPGGIYLGHAPAIPLDYVCVNRLFKRIVCGLYYQLYRRRLPDDTSFDIRRINPPYKNQVVEQLNRIGVKESRFIGTEFECLHTLAIEDSTVTSWLMRFFNIYISVTTNLDKHEVTCSTNSTAAFLSQPR